MRMQHLIKRVVKVQVQIYNRDFTFAFFDSVIDRRASFLFLKHYLMEEPRFYHSLVSRGGLLFCLRFLHYHPGGSYHNTLLLLLDCLGSIRLDDNQRSCRLSSHLQVEVGHPSSSLCKEGSFAFFGIMQLIRVWTRLCQNLTYPWLAHTYLGQNPS